MFKGLGGVFQAVSKLEKKLSVVKSLTLNRYHELAERLPDDGYVRYLYLGNENRAHGWKHLRELWTNLAENEIKKSGMALCRRMVLDNIPTGGNHATDRL